MVCLDKCDGSSNTLDDFFGRLCVPNKTKDIKVFNMKSGIN